MPSTIDEVNLFSEEMQLHYASPNKNLVAEIMQLDAAQLSDLASDEVSKYVFVLGQYLVMLQYNENFCNVKYKLAQKSFEYKLNKVKFGRGDIEGKTMKERDNWILFNVPEVKEAYDEVATLDAKKTLIDGMVRAVEGLLNALKKEMSGRFGEREH